MAVADNLGPLCLADLSDATIERLGEILDGERLGAVVAASILSI